MADKAHHISKPEKWTQIAVVVGVDYQFKNVGTCKLWMVAVSGPDEPTEREAGDLVERGNARNVRLEANETFWHRSAEFADGLIFESLLA
jgi:hypothetical protein